MTTILIPTDFSLESTKIIDALLITQKIEDARLIFVHAYKLSDSITDMLMLSRRSRDYDYISDEFYAKIDACQQKYQDKIKGIGIEYFYGSTVVAFKNFLDAHQVDRIAYAKDFQFKPLNRYSIDPMLLINRCGCKSIALDTHAITAEEKLIETKMYEASPTVVIA